MPLPARGIREEEAAGQVALPGLVGRNADQAAVWVKRRPKLQLRPASPGSVAKLVPMPTVSVNVSPVAPVPVPAVPPPIQV